MTKPTADWEKSDLLDHIDKMHDWQLMALSIVDRLTIGVWCRWCHEKVCPSTCEIRMLKEASQ